MVGAAAVARPHERARGPIGRVRPHERDRAALVALIRRTVLLVFWIGARVGALEAQECQPARTALVLSGGGAKGLAHIEVLAVLDSLGVRPDLVVGTSMGAIVGSLYASGYSAHQIDSLARALPVSEIVRPFHRPAPHPWDHRIPLLFLIKGRGGFALETGLLDETEPNALLNTAMLRGNLLARGDFSRLPIPFLAVATDLRDRSTVVLSQGDLARAVRASSALPLIFPPVVADGAVLVDGGLSANVPIGEARAAGASRVIVSDVTEPLEDTLDVESPVALADQLLGFLFRQPPAELGADDVLVRPVLDGFRSLDFSLENLRRIRARGRRAAEASLGKARCLPVRPPPAVPPLPKVLAGWTVSSGRSDSALVSRMLDLDAGGRIDPAELRERLMGLTDAEAFRGVWLNPEGSADSVRFRLEPIRAPSTVGGGGLGYDHETGGRVWAGVFNRRLLGTSLEASTVVSLSRLQREGYGAVLWHADGSWSRLTPTVTVRLRTEDVRQFDAEGEELAAMPTTDGHVGVGVELRLGDPWRVRIAGDGYAWGRDDRRGLATLGGTLRVERHWHTGPVVHGELVMAGRFQSARTAATWRIADDAWRIVPSLRLGWGNDLPLQRTFPLGGEDGFPGIHLGEQRGTREVFLSSRVGYAVKGPLEARLSLAAGRAWTPAASGNDWLGGFRLGLGADTPIGPMDLAYGVATNGRGAFFLRIGQWF